MLRTHTNYKQDKLTNTRFALALVARSTKYTVKFLKNRCVVERIVK